MSTDAISDLFPGRPVWVDYAADDPKAAQEWYGGLMPWEFESSGPEYGNYIRARFEGDDVAGIFQRPEGAPVGWTVYLHSDDVQETCRKAVEFGGGVAAEPFDVPMVGEMAVILDSNFAATGIWKTSGMPVIDLQQRYGSVWWENWSTNTARAEQFYREVFGLATSDLEGMDYKVLEHGDLAAGGVQVGALGGMQEPTQAPPIWAVYFSTHDVDAACAYTASNGGRIEREPEDTPFGRMAECFDAFGALFKVMTPPM